MTNVPELSVLMLGWEYPPLISGGLATASEGLTRAMAGLGVHIDFVVPKKCGQEDDRHMSIYSCHELKSGSREWSYRSRDRNLNANLTTDLEQSSILNHMKPYYSAYARPEVSKENLDCHSTSNAFKQIVRNLQSLSDQKQNVAFEFIPIPFENRLFYEVNRYAQEVSQTSENLQFDLIHAHDWMTYPAAVMIANIRKKPLVVHVHSLESDRCGDGGNEVITAIERLGLQSADRIIAVSDYTRKKICSRYGIKSDRIAVAHNGVKQNLNNSLETTRSFPSHLISKNVLEVKENPESKCDAKNFEMSKRKRILFLGRVTFQKGPDYFIEAATKILEKIQSVVFVLAGDGDMLPYIRERVRNLGIDSYFEFPGFLVGKALEDEYRRADLFVMPSVSEPFGIAPLEALIQGTPALISKQSGVSEVLNHVLKVDFWDVLKMADFILNSILHPELGRSMMEMNRKEVRKLRWEETAKQVRNVYQNLLFEYNYKGVS